MVFITEKEAVKRDERERTGKAESGICSRVYIVYRLRASVDQIILNLGPFQPSVQGLLLGWRRCSILKRSLWFYKSPVSRGRSRI